MPYPHIYDDPAERWLVELRVSYDENETALGNDGTIDTPAKAAAAALDLTRDVGAGGTHWTVTDRKTGEVFVLEQRTFADNTDFYTKFTNDLFQIGDE